MPKTAIFKQVEISGELTGSFNLPVGWAAVSGFPTFTFTPRVSGEYKVTLEPQSNGLAAGHNAQYQVMNTVGGATVLQRNAPFASTSVNESRPVNIIDSIWLLTAGVAYTFTLSANSSSGSNTIDLGITSYGSYWVAQQIS